MGHLAMSEEISGCCGWGQGVLLLALDRAEGYGASLNILWCVAQHLVPQLASSWHPSVLCWEICPQALLSPAHRPLTQPRRGLGQVDWHDAHKGGSTVLGTWEVLGYSGRSGCCKGLSPSLLSASSVLKATWHLESSPLARRACKV